MLNLPKSCAMSFTTPVMATPAVQPWRHELHTAKWCEVPGLLQETLGCSCSVRQLMVRCCGGTPGWRDSSGCRCQAGMRGYRGPGGGAAAGTATAAGFCHAASRVPRFRWRASQHLTEAVDCLWSYFASSLLHAGSLIQSTEEQRTWLFGTTKMPAMRMLERSAEQVLCTAQRESF